MDENKERDEAEQQSSAAEANQEADLEDDEVEVWVVNDEGEPIEDPPSTGAVAAASAGEGALQKELDEARNQWMRTLADFDNFRKRADREKSDLKRYALLEPMRDLLPVIDNLQRALEADGTVDDLKQGVEMTLSQMIELLRRRGLEPVEAVGHPFDPAVHDAVSRFEDGEVSQPTVSDELQRGYRLHDRLLRPSMVRVAMPPEGEEKPTQIE